MPAGRDEFDSGDEIQRRVRRPFCLRLSLWRGVERIACHLGTLFNRQRLGQRFRAGGRSEADFERAFIFQYGRLGKHFPGLHGFILPDHHFILTNGDAPIAVGARL